MRVTLLVEAVTRMPFQASVLDLTVRPVDQRRST